MVSGRTFSGAGQMSNGLRVETEQPQRVKMETFQQLQPMIVHLLEKLTFDGVSRYRADDRIDATFGAKCGVAVVSPMFELARRKDLQTIEASADIALFERFSMVA